MFVLWIPSPYSLNPEISVKSAPLFDSMNNCEGGGGVVGKEVGRRCVCEKVRVVQRGDRGEGRQEMYRDAAFNENGDV